MSIFDTHLPRENLHHAYLIEGESELLLPELFSFFESIGISTTANPDVSHEIYESFTIADARIFRKRQMEKSIGGGKNILILSIGEFQREAEQALLKVFEEPAPNVHFFIFMKSIATVSPTIRSRFQILYLNTENKSIKEKEQSLIGKKFVAQSKKERLDTIAKIIKRHKDEDESSSLLKREALDLVNAIELFIHKSKSPNFSKEDLEIFKSISLAREYIPLRGSSVKMVLENIALML